MDCKLSRCKLLQNQYDACLSTRDVSAHCCMHVQPLTAGCNHPDTLTYKCLRKHQEKSWGSDIAYGAEGSEGAAVGRRRCGSGAGGGWDMAGGKGWKVSDSGGGLAGRAAGTGKGWGEDVSVQTPTRGSLDLMEGHESSWDTENLHFLHPAFRIGKIMRSLKPAECNCSI